MIFENLDPEAYDREYSDRRLLGRAGAYFARDRGRLILIALVTAAGSALYAAVPILIARGVGQLQRGPLTPFPTALVVALFATWLLIWITNFVRRSETARAVGAVVLALRQDAFGAAVGHDLSFYDRFASGRIVSRITSDSQDFGQTVTLVTEQVAQLAQLAILVVVLYALSPQLTLLLLAWSPVVFGLALAFRAVARRVTRQGARAMAEVNAKIFETVAGIGVAKNFRREATIYGEFQQVNVQSYHLNLRRGATLSAVFPALNVLAGAGTALLVYFGALSVVSGAIALGAWYLFLQSVEAFWFPMMNLSAFWSQVQAGLAALERVFALIDAEPAVRQRGADPVPSLAGEIRLEGVGFRYDGGEPVLADFWLTIAPGESVALVGHTGAGKSSIARLVARFYEFQDGRLLVDGHDIRTFDLRAYRHQLGIVPQAPFLFRGTVAENIRYARPDATDGEIDRLARRIGQGEWLAALPQGLATPVGERGARLSMGQRQLVALLRVLLQRPAIFILDEATASVDPFTEAQIQEALALILADRTSLVIAHRLTTVRAADRILVLEHGRILEAGAHEALLAAGGPYATLYQTYFRHQSLDYRPSADGGPVAAAAAAAVRPSG
jgi:ATP-binding cassette subfamily B protein